jgi:hypothetical protein
VSGADGLVVGMHAGVQTLPDDLCDFNGTRLGPSISIALADVDLAAFLPIQSRETKAESVDRPE